MTWESPRITRSSYFLFTNPDDAHPLGTGNTDPWGRGHLQLCAPAFCCLAESHQPSQVQRQDHRQVRGGHKWDLRPGAAHGHLSQERSALKGVLVLAPPWGLTLCGLWVAHFLESSCAHFTSFLNFASLHGHLGSMLGAGWGTLSAPLPPPLSLCLPLPHSFMAFWPLLVPKRPKQFLFVEAQPGLHSVCFVIL